MEMPAAPQRAFTIIPGLHPGLLIIPSSGFLSFMPVICKFLRSGLVKIIEERR